MLLAPVSTRPKKAYGQHFLRDPNILEVIGRLAELGPDDVVLEIGPGQGVLTRYLAERVGRVQAIEIDRALEPALSALPDNVDVSFGDALQLELPQDATKLVANLPYNVATPLIVESLDGLPNVRLWCVMVQREVADRLFAGPGSKDYGAVSVLVQLAAERTGFHPVSRWVFQPPPNVDPEEYFLFTSRAIKRERRGQILKCQPFVPVAFGQLLHVLTLCFGVEWR